MPTVSVIIPTFNRSKYVTKAIESVLAQTYHDYEIIVVDDGSTDDTKNRLLPYMNQIKYIFQENAGPGTARNRGIKECTASFVAFLDSDDEWLPEFLSTSMEHLKKDNDCALSVVGFYFNEKGDARATQTGYGKYRLPDNLTPRQFKIELDKCTIGTVLCRRSILERFGGCYENHCLYGEDVYLWIQVLLNYPIFYDPTALMIYHIENSELGLYGKSGFRPPKPYLTDPVPILRNCPEKYRDMLEEFLAYYALSAYHSCLRVGKEELCVDFINQFPLMKKWRWEYAKLQIKLACPFLRKSVQGYKLLFR